MSDSLRSFSMRAWVMWAVAASFYFYQFILRVSPNVMSAELMEHFQINASSFSALVSSYYWSYVPLQIPLGILMDRFGPRRILTLAVAFLAIGTFCFVFSNHIAAAYMGRFLMGAGSACAFLGCIKVASIWLPPSQLSLAIGITSSLGMIGATGGGGPLASMVSFFGWKTTLLIIGMVAAFMILLIWAFIRDNNASTTIQESSAELIKKLKNLARTRQNWLISFYVLLIFMPMTVFGELWGASFLMERYNVDCVKAATASSLIYIGFMFGAPAFAWVSDRLKSRKKPMVLSPLSVLCFYAALLYIPDLPFSVAYVLLFLAGFMAGGEILGFTMICEANEIHLRGTAVGFTNAICSLSGILLQPLVGQILDWRVRDQVVDTCSIKVYSASDFMFGLSVIPICTLLAFIIILFVRETFMAETKG